MNIILIGNGKTLLGKGLGSQIDQYDLVVRFNNFVLSHEEDLGTKFDAHARRSCDDIQLFNPKSLSLVVNTITPCPLSVAMQSIANGLKQYYGDIYSEYSLSESQKLLGKVGLNKNQRLSVGIMTIAYFLDRYEKIAIANFDLSYGTDANHHYFKKPPRDARFHDWQKEHDYITGLITEGRIEVLG